MSLELDIKANDAFEQSALKAATALDRTAKAEQQVDAMAGRIAKSYRDAGVSAQQIAKYTELYGRSTDKTYGASQKIAQVGKKDRSALLSQINKAYAAEKKVVDKEKEQKELIKKGALAYAAVTGAIVAAGVAAGALGLKIAESAKSAYDAKRNASALLDAFTARRGPQALALLDGLAGKLGQSFGDVRAQFVEFRKAGLSNDLSAKLIKMRADLLAVGLSAGEADKEIALVTSAADGLGNVGAQRKLAELSRAYGGIGSGAAAANHALTSLSGAENKIGNAASEKLAELWTKIGPAIGKAANQLADFVVKLLNGEKGQAAIDGIASAFVAVADSVGPALDGVSKVFAFLSAEKIPVLAGIATALTGIGIAFAVAFGPAIVVATAAAVAAAALPLAIGAAAVGVGLAVHQIIKHWDDLKLIAGEMYDAGVAAVTGLISGITSKISSAVESAKDLAKSIAAPFAKALGIQSPSKVFAGYGRDTVEGFELGVDGRTASAQKTVQTLGESAAVGFERGSTDMKAPRTRELSARAPSGTSVVIEQLIVNGGGDAEEIAMTVRRELQLLFQAGSLSQGLA